MNATITTTTTYSRREPEWFAAWFDSPHYHKLYAHRSDAEAARFIDALIAVRKLAAGAAVLDLGCGAGRHARYLASKGFDVTGLDLSEESLRQARSSESATLRFVRQDMRAPFGDGRFDHVLNLFTSFGYFDDAGDNLTVVQNIAASLRPGGSVVIDYLNVLEAERHLTPEQTTERDGVVFRLSRWADADHIFKRIAIDDGRAAPVTFTERVARLGADDFRFMFALCGLAIEETYGDYDLAPFDPSSSPRLIVTGRKRAATDSAAGQVLPDAADRFGRHAEVRREHGLRHAEDDRRIGLEELEVTLLG
jgi:SAM-dependent methyltransferase